MGDARGGADGGAEDNERRHGRGRKGDLEGAVGGMEEKHGKRKVMT